MSFFFAISYERMFKFVLLCFVDLFCKFELG